jgi:hypothetical protein
MSKLCKHNWFNIRVTLSTRPYSLLIASNVREDVYERHTLLDHRCDLVGLSVDTFA